MNKNEIKNILNEIIIERKEDEHIIRELLTTIENKSNEEIQKITKNFNDNMAKKEILRIIENKRKMKQSFNKFYKLNDYYEYGVTENCVHIHLPGDLHSMFQKLGKRKAIATLGEQLIDAVNRLNNDKNIGLERLKECTDIYMLSPIFYAPTFYPQNFRKLKLNSPILEIFNKIGINTESFMQNDLNDPKFVSTHPSAQVVIKHFGTGKDVGSASISFKEINSKKWQKKFSVLSNVLKNMAGITKER